MNDPFKQIDERFNIIEALLHNIQNAIGLKNPNERITRAAIVDEYKVCFGTIHNAMNNGALKFDKVGSKTLFKRSDVEAWVQRK